ncbi:MAG: hypothetical protein Q9167_000613 [Letrouitia subvulpina]
MRYILSLPLLALAAPAIAVPAQELEARQFGGGSSSSTRNDVKNNAPCKPLTVIFARGTSEPGNVGSVAGPPFFNALNSALPNQVNVQGVDYAATWNGAFSGGDAAGSRTMASLVGQAVSQCPSTQIVLSGYSQGGQLVHNAAKTLSADLTAKISSVVIFGDPYNGQAVGSVPASKVDEICAPGDSICSRGGTGGGSPGGGGSGHLSYGSYATSAAAFVKSKFTPAA